jgi:hypothetical protein
MDKGGAKCQVDFVVQTGFPTNVQYMVHHPVSMIDTMDCTRVIEVLTFKSEWLMVKWNHGNSASSPQN